MIITSMTGDTVPATHCIHEIPIADPCRKCEKELYQPKRRRRAAK